MSTSVTPAERLLDLVIALTHTRHRMTKADIRRRVNGYSSDVPDDTFERMFERDKVTLRELGIPLLTLTDDAHGDDIGYRIDLEGYDLPPIELSAEEIGVLSVAAQVWDGAHLDSPARRALTKLRAVAPAASREFQGHTLRMPPPEATFDVLLAAISSHHVVTFDYRAASSREVTKRRVEPWRLLVRDGAWYLQGWDRTRDDERLFRLSRVQGKVRSAPGATQSVGPPATAAPKGGTARLSLAPDRATDLRLRAIGPTTADPERAGNDLIEVAVDDLDDLAGLIAGFTDSVVVVEPVELRQAVIARLRAAAQLGVSRG